MHSFRRITIHTQLIAINTSSMRFDQVIKYQYSAGLLKKNFQLWIRFFLVFNFEEVEVELSPF